MRRLILGIALLIVCYGLFSRHVIPIWWHIIFLAMLVPVCMYGASLRKA